MANAVYPEYYDAAMGGGSNTDILTSNVKAVLIDSADYTFSTAHEFLDDVAAAARIGTSPNLSGKTLAAGVFNADDVTVSSVSGDPGEALIVYIDTGTEGTSRLLGYVDGLSYTPDGNNITITWPAAGIIQFAG